MAWTEDRVEKLSELWDKGLSASQIAKELAEGVTLVDMMVQVGFDKSKSAARRLINQGAVRINDVKITDGAYALSEADFQDGAMTLRSGKKKVHRVVLKGA